MPRIRKVGEAKKPKAVEETTQECCPICLGNYTEIIRKKIVCKYCNQDACSKCIERYLIERIEDAHCLHCRVNYNDTTLREICTRTFLHQVYYKHRQEILMAKERSVLPGFQQRAIEERRYRARYKFRLSIWSKIRELNNEYKFYKNLLNYSREKQSVPRTSDELSSDLKYEIQLRVKMKQIKNSIIHERQKILDENGEVVENVEQETTTVTETEEKRKFIRRCTRDGCQGFLSTAWKCGICDYYSCNKCFKVKSKVKDDPHTCLKEDIETAEMIKKDSKPCPKCGEFIFKVSGCSQMFCITCQTPWDWNTGKIVTEGTIHNPHYYEWLKRNGRAVPRNPADIPCGGYPDIFDLRLNIRLMSAGKTPPEIDNFYEFHRVCMEIQALSQDRYRSHERDISGSTNVMFLLGDFDEKKWGQLLAKNERIIKRDAELQEVFVAFRIVAIELINRLYQYRDEHNRKFEKLPIEEALEFIKNINTEFQALFVLVNDGFRQISLTYNYSVPYIITENNHHRISVKNYTADTIKRRPTAAKKKKMYEEIVANAGAGVPRETDYNQDIDATTYCKKDESVDDESVVDESMV